MSYIGAEPTTAAFPFDQFSGNGSTTAFTLTYAPASATSIIVAISGVMQNPNLYSVVGTTLTFSPAPPTGTNNISVLYLGLPVIGSSSPGNTAFLSSTDLTATASQTVFASAGSYTPGFVQVYRNGARLGAADFTATNGTTITLASAATAGDLVTIEYYTLTSLTNALPLTGGTVTGSTTFNSTVTVNGAAVSGFTGMKNRIINGNMAVSQRNGATATSQVHAAYNLDRFWGYSYNSSPQTGKYTVAQSSTAPTGFVNSLLVTSSASTAVSANDLYSIGQHIEGLNTNDLAWGTASASTVTLSFWVRCSLTGTFGGIIKNQNNNYNYPFQFTISSANTFEYKTITVSGPTSGTWQTDNSTGLTVSFNLQVGTSITLPANGTWQALSGYGATGCVNILNTNGATFYITGVQLERGSNATSFEFIDYGRQLAQCQRYYESQYASNGTMGSNGNFIALGLCETTSRVQPYYPFKVQKRASPSATLSAISTFGIRSTSSSFVCTSGTFGATNTTYANGEFNNGGGGLVAGGAGWLTNHNGDAKIEWSAEL